MLKIVALGDSLTEGFGLRREDSFTSVLQSRLKDSGIECEVINAGISGDTTYGGLNRLDFYLKEFPHIVIVELGINDGFLEYPIEEIERNLEKIVDKAKGYGCEVLLIGSKIPEKLFDIPKKYCMEFENIFYRVQKKYNIPLVHDILGGIIGNPQFTLDDMIHPNEEGVKLMVDKVLKKLICLISSKEKTLDDKEGKI